MTSSKTERTMGVDGEHESLGGDSVEFRYRDVERRLAAMIESGGIAPGEKLPSLRSVSRSMGASMSTATRAFMELERKGLIESRPRSGFFALDQRRQLPTPEVSSQAASEPRRINRSQLIGKVLESVGDRTLIPFWLVCPDEKLLPGRQLARIMASVLREFPDQSMSYTKIRGLWELRKQVALRAMDWGGGFGPDDAIVTTGAMEALYISLRCLTRPGDTVLIQSPTYYCFLQLLETLGLRAVEISSDPDTGIDPADVASALDTFDVRACVLSANFNNPDGSLLSDEAKREILAILNQRNVPLVEDDVAGDLHFGPDRPSTFKSHDHPDPARGTVIHCSSFSKTIAPGYRAGWMIPGRFMDKALEIKATTNVCCATPTQMAVAEYLAQGHYTRHIKKLREAMERQMGAIRHHLSMYFPEGTRVTRPQGGAVLWVELPGGVDSVRLFHMAKEQGVGIAPGAIFSTRDRFNNYIRLSCGVVWGLEIEDGLRRLGVLAAQCAEEA